MDITRREVLQGALVASASLALTPSWVLGQSSTIITKKIPSSGEAIPVVGIGTSRRYDNPDAATRTELEQVFREFAKLGGKVIDSAPSYGTAETVVGDIMAATGTRPKLFLATKVSSTGKEAGVAQIEASFTKMKTDKIDLIAVHNLQDTPTQLATLRELKQKGRIRYVGITTSNERQYADFEATMKAETLDFVQFDYAIDNREAEARLLPLAAERGMAVMVNLPFGRGRVFEAVQGKPLPEWAKEFDCASWAQFFLKYIVSHPAVTCVIPGTARTKYVPDNFGAAMGRLPNAAMRTKMEQVIAAV